MSNKINELLENLNRKIDIFPEEMDKCVDPETIEEFKKKIQQFEIWKTKNPNEEILTNIKKLEQQINIFIETITDCIERKSRAERAANQATKKATAVEILEAERLAKKEAEQNAKTTAEEQAEIQRQNKSKIREKAIEEREKIRKLISQMDHYIAPGDINYNNIIKYPEVFNAYIDKAKTKLTDKEKGVLNYNDISTEEQRKAFLEDKNIFLQRLNKPFSFGGKHTKYKKYKKTNKKNANRKNKTIKKRR